ncbi:unnamed protein product [Dicrocoelium dendriticum]|nr:unnamed protein product [Dicrocoelium dendriticum]
MKSSPMKSHRHVTFSSAAALSRKYLLIFLVICSVSAVLLLHSAIRQSRGRSSAPKLLVPIVHQEEKQFPLAFSIMIYTDLDRALRLMQVIYRAHNFYCIHVDRETDDRFYSTLTLLMQRRYGNSVYVVPRRDSFKVQWGRLSALDADLLCSRVLLGLSSRWKYWINLTGQEFPLKTNWEMVRALSLINGSNLIGATFEHRNLDRFPLQVNFDFPLIWYKGSAHIAARREFVQFVHENKRAILILQVLRDFEQQEGRGVIADETYFPTLNHNPVSLPVPGAFLGVHESDVFKPPIRAKVWYNTKLPCRSGKWIRGICMLGLRDVDWLKDRPELFANKFIPSVEPEGYTELERWLREKLLYESAHNCLHPSFNATHYLSLELRWNHL